LKSGIEEDTIINPIYFADILLCDGCEKKFLHAIRNSGDERFCKWCFSHRFGVEETTKVQKLLNELSNYLWETPIDEISEQVKSKLDFIVKQKVDNT